MFRRIALIVLAVVLVLLLCVGSALYVFVQTDWGRERTRRLAIAQLGKVVHGRFHVGELRGDLLRGATLVDVWITDSTGAPFLRADTIQARYTLKELLRKRINLRDIRLVRPDVVLDRKPGEPWNYDRIFPRDTLAPPGPPGIGSWVTLRNVTVVDGKVTVNALWKPDSTLTAREQDSVIKFALGPLGRQAITRVGSGFQNTSKFWEINGTLPYLRLMDPANPGQVIDADGVSLVAQPFRPPTVRVVSVAGRFTILNDSLYFKNTKVRLTGSQLVGDGRYNIANNDLRLRLHANPVATNDLLWIDPNIPRDGKGALDFALDWVGTDSDYLATRVTMAVAGAQLAGSFGVLVNDSMTFHDTDLTFSRLNTQTIQQLFPTLASPRQGYLSGTAKVKGSLGQMQLDADVAFDDPHTGVSRLIAKGGLGLPTVGNEFRADNLHLELLPVHVTLGKIFLPDLPIGGEITGVALLNGSTAERLNVQADLTHTDTTGVSRILGDVAYGAGKTPVVNADVQLLPLSLSTVGRFAPLAGLRGTVSGPVQLSGPLNSMVLDARLVTPDSGAIVVQGLGDFAAKVPRYSATVNATLFDASQVSNKSPQTSISADMTVRGTGIDLVTMKAELSAHMRASQYDSVHVDSAAIRISADSGLLSVDTLALRLPKAEVNVAGTFGLSDTKRGTLQYDVTIDSLSALSRFIKTDTGAVAPRPGVLKARTEKARADSARIAKATEVERAVTGAPAPKLVVDTPQVIRRETLAGSVEARGTISGNIYSVDVLGTAIGRKLIAMGSSVGVANARYDLRKLLTSQPTIEGGVIAADLLAYGFALDTVVGSVNHLHPNGSASIQIRQDDRRVYGVAATYAMNQSQNNIYLDEARLQFDTAIYTTSKASLIRYGDRGIDIDAFEMFGPNGSRVYLDGLIPKEGDALLDLKVTRFDIANVMTLMQSDVNASGLVTLDVTAEGTVDNPKLKGSFSAEQFSYNSNPIPELHGSVDYANKTLNGSISANMAGRPPILVASGTVPIDLRLVTVEGSRVPTDRQIDVKVVADSLPLGMIPEATDAVTGLSGNATANFTVAGTLDKPDVEGFVSLENGAMRLAANGVRYTDMNGYVRLIRDSVVIDSLYARSRGYIRVAGGIGIQKLSEPSFALKLQAANLRVLDNEFGRIEASAKLEMKGPFKRVLIDGTARVNDGFIYIPDTHGKTLITSDDPLLYSVLDTAIPAERALFPPPSPLIANLQLNVTVGVDRDVFVRTREANVELYTDDDLQVSLDQAARTIRLDGTLLSDRGEYRFQGKRFVVKRGTALFTNTATLDPTLQITAEYDVQFSTREAILIQILIGGTLSKPKITLTSDAQPPISQTDLLSYLAFGESSSTLLQFGGNGLTTGGSGGSNLVGQGAAFAAQQVAAAALGAVTDEVASEVGRSIGADVLTISPAPVSLDAASVLRGTEIQFGKYVSNRTFVGLQVRPDPESLKRPGFQITHRFSLRRGYRAEASLEPRYLQKDPTLDPNQTPVTTSAFGLFFIREWRF